MTPDTRSTHEHLGLHSRLQVLRRRKWIFLLAAVVVPAAALAYSLHQPKKYEASSDILLGRQSAIANLTGAPDLSSVADPQRIVNTEAALAREPQVASRVLRALRLRDRGPEDLLGQSSVSAQPDTNLITIHVTDRSGPLAVGLANSYAKQFTSFVLARDTKQLRTALGNVQKRIAALQASDRSSQLYTNLADREEQLQTALALQTGNATVVRTSTAATQVQPQPVRNALLGLVLGLVLGVALAFIRETLDTRVKTAEEIGAILHQPLLARIPRPGRRLRSRDRLVMLGDATSPEAEPFRVLRTNLEFANLDRGARTILVTSALEQEGKSTTAANLAVSLAKAGNRVTLVDLDLRKPFIHRFFDLQMSPGLTDVALGNVGLLAALVDRLMIDDSGQQLSLARDVLRPSREAGEEARDPWLFSDPGSSEWDTGVVGENGRQAVGGTLSILPSGPIPPDPGEFVGSRFVKAILAELAARTDFVIIDSPPLLHVSDALTLSAHVDGIVVVARVDLVRRQTLAELHRVLESCPTAKLGFVVTDAGGAGQYSYGYGTYHAEASKPRVREVSS